MCPEAEPSEPVRPGWSTEGQAGLRARRWAWPSEPIGLVPKIRVVRVDLSSQAQVQRTTVPKLTFTTQIETGLKQFCKEMLKLTKQYFEGYIRA